VHQAVAAFCWGRPCCRRCAQAVCSCEDACLAVAKRCGAWGPAATCYAPWPGPASSLVVVPPRGPSETAGGEWRAPHRRRRCRHLYHPPASLRGLLPLPLRPRSLPLPACSYGKGGLRMCRGMGALVLGAYDNDDGGAESRPPRRRCSRRRRHRHCCGSAPLSPLPPLSAYGHRRRGWFPSLALCGARLASRPRSRTNTVLEGPPLLHHPRPPT